MRVNEIFYSLQGEGHFTGTPAVFLRLAGCNLDCPFCDTQHQAYRPMNERQILNAVMQHPSRHIVITGGEPAMQLNPTLMHLLHDEGFFVQIETNGSVPLKRGVKPDWVTCSPKDADVVLKHIDELKLLFIDRYMQRHADLKASEYRLQPLDTGDEEKNSDTLDEAIQFILDNPKWKLSLQTHKILDLK